MVWTGSARTLTPNGTLIEAYRKSQGWTREEFEWQSHLAVEKAALSENIDCRFHRRYKLKTRAGKFAGIGTTTLANIENNKPVYAFTLKIVAETFGVPVQDLMQLDAHSNKASPLIKEIGPANEIVDNIMHAVNTDRHPLTAYELAQVVRNLLDQLFP